MSAAKPRWPQPVVFERKFLVSGWEADCLVASILGLPAPARPEKDELLTARELAAKVKCAPETAVRRLRASLRQGAAADA